MSIKALNNALKPLIPFLSKENVTEICINQSEEIYLEQNRIFKKILVPELSLSHLEMFSDLVAEFNEQSLSRESPILSGNLPGGERIQIVRTPACEKGKIVMAIRRPNTQDFTLDDYNKMRAFERDTQYRQIDINTKLKALLQERHYQEFISLAIKSKKNILISGGTGTGKTTFLNACLKYIPEAERLITLEDAREVKVIQPNTVHLIVPSKEQGVANVTVERLFESCLRLRPDRIFLSEIRGGEVFAFLEAINSGHPGSLSTIHADSCSAAFEQIYRKMRRYGDKSERQDVMNYLHSIIDIVIQLKRCSSALRYMYVSDIYFQEQS
jgi:type IV secretion system protein VirB11